MSFISKIGGLDGWLDGGQEKRIDFRDYKNRENPKFNKIFNKLGRIGGRVGGRQGGRMGVIEEILDYRDCKSHDRQKFKNI